MSSPNISGKMPNPIPSLASTIAQQARPIPFPGHHGTSVVGIPAVAIAEITVTGIPVTVAGDTIAGMFGLTLCWCNL
jgi:hypothetical protein